jgi:hypothetical protein
MILKKYFLIILLLPLLLQAQERDYSKDPGYVDFGDLTRFEKDDNITEIYLDEGLLGMVSKMSNDEDSKFIGGLKLIRVNVFQVDSLNHKSVRNKINEIDKGLMAKKWNRIVRTKSKNEVVNVYIKQEANKRISGLVVTTIEEKGEAAFINIVGEINLEDMGKLGARFNIPSISNGQDKKK